MDKSLLAPNQDQEITADIENLFSQYSVLLELLYSSSLSPTGFQAFLDKMVETFDLADISIYFTKKATLEVYSAWLSGPKAPALIEFVDRKLDSANYVMDYVHSHPMSRFYSLDQDIGRSNPETRTGVVLESEEWFDGHGYRDMCGAVIHHDSESMASIVAHRLIEQGPFQQRELLILDNLMPHIKQAYLLYRQKEQHGTIDGWSKVINHIPHATMLFGARGELLDANLDAQRAIAKHSGIEIVDQELKFKSPLVARQFIVKMLKACCLDFTEQQSFEIVSLSDDAEGEVKFIITPIAINHENKGALVYILTNHIANQPNTALLKELYHLSDMEIKVCECCLRGLNRQEIADKLNRSPYTIKDHLKSIFTKTGTRRQSELIVTILTTTNLPSPPTWGEN
ncbi:helix-turn-helix transcriptional regulator [Vibrio maritimus]|uniref:helix-turn-helix transcriptional regulator n=1 Tax=Vibrio maritimus TaxID=990268 RepID=UPI0037353691